MKFSYYPGCTLKTKGKDLDRYARLSAEALGFTLEELARIAHLSRSTFLRRFKSITGGTPAEYVTDLRVSAAKSMLVDTAISISDIAITVGFYDSPHFSRVFKSKTGLSPIAYRNKKN